MKKRFKLLAVAGATLLALAACGSSGEEGNGDSTDGPVEIDFWYGLGSIAGQTMENIIEDFNASQDEYRVTGVQQADYETTWQNVQASLAAGEAPAVFLIVFQSFKTMAETMAYWPIYLIYMILMNLRVMNYLKYLQSRLWQMIALMQCQPTERLK